MPIVAIQGTHLIRFIADEAHLVLDGDRSDNEGTLSLIVPPAALPDLAIGTVTFAPSPAAPGEHIVVNATVTNAGADGAASRLAVRLNGAAIGTYPVPPLRAGTETAVSFSLTAPASTGRVELTADAEGVIPELNESNNSADVPLPVVASGLTLSGVASPASAGPETAIAFTIEAAHTSTTAREVFFDASVASGSGTLVKTLASGVRQVLTASSVTNRSYSFNTARLVAGPYALRVVVRSGGRYVGSLEVPFTVRADAYDVSTELVADRDRYRPGESVVLTQRLTNASRNVALQGASLIVTVSTLAGSELHRATRAIADLLAGEHVDTTDLFAIAATLPPGAYRARSEPVVSGTTLSTATTTFQVVYEPADTVTGTLSAANSFRIDAPLPVTVTLSNAGALAVVQGQLHVSLINATTLVLESAATAAADVPAFGTALVSLSLSTRGIQPGDKLLVLELGGRTLDKLLLAAELNHPPVAKPQTVETNEDVERRITLQASDADGDPLTYDVVNPPLNGKLDRKLDGAAPDLVYKPNSNFFGTDSFTFTVSDGRETSAPATVSISIIAVNDPPVAIVGPDQTVNEDQRVVLDGAGSDVDNDPLEPHWQQIAGPKVALDDVTDPAHPAFIAPRVPAAGTTLTFQLTVTDRQLSSSPATVNIHVKNVNQRPVAVSGADQQVKEDVLVTLDGTDSYDRDAEPLTYTWTQIIGPVVKLSNDADPQPSFTAPLVGRMGDTVTFSLTVNDGIEDSRPDEVSVRIENVNHAPVANAGSDQTKDEGTLVVLDGSDSKDPDKEPLTYAWAQQSGPPVSFDDPTSATPSFRTPLVAAGGEVLVFHLVVNDGLSDSPSDEVLVNVLNVNDPPACNLARPSINTLWPPNHKLVPIEILGVTDPQKDNVKIRITRVTQDEPVRRARRSDDRDDDDDRDHKDDRDEDDDDDGGRGDLNTSPDAVIQGSSLLLRAERSAKGDGRVYMIRFVADGQGGSCKGTVTVGVPRSKNRAPIDSGQRYDSTRP
ncbi:MAG TPA: tandem-95 repeat protein [Vicinamibacterales bacterium]